MRIHPENCGCKICKKKKKQNKKDIAFVKRSMFLVLIFFIICL